MWHITDHHSPVMKEFIKVNGFQVAPAELEGCLLEHPDVLESCVVGVPNERSMFIHSLPLAPH